MHVVGIIVSAVFLRRYRRVALPSLLAWVCLLVGRIVSYVALAISTNHDFSYAESDVIWRTGLIVQSILAFGAICLLVAALVPALRARTRAG